MNRLVPVVHKASSFCNLRSSNIVVLEEVIHKCHGVGWLLAYHHRLGLILKHLLVLFGNGLVVGDLLDIVVQPLLCMLIEVLRELLQVPSFNALVAVGRVVRVLTAVVGAVRDYSPPTRLAPRVIAGRTLGVCWSLLWQYNLGWQSLLVIVGTTTWKRIAILSSCYFVQLLSFHVRWCLRMLNLDGSASVRFNSLA